MLRWKLYTMTTLLGVLALVSMACTTSPTPTMTATPLEVPNEGIRGEYITVTLQLSAERPCTFVLSTEHKTEIENYLAPYSARKLTYPDNNNVVTLHEQIPFGTPSGVYVLKVVQMTHDGDDEGTEVFNTAFLVQ